MTSLAYSKKCKNNTLKKLENSLPPLSLLKTKTIRLENPSTLTVSRKDHSLFPKPSTTTESRSNHCSMIQCKTLGVNKNKYSVSTKPQKSPLSSNPRLVIPTTPHSKPLNKSWSKSSTMSRKGRRKLNKLKKQHLRNNKSDIETKM